MLQGWLESMAVIADEVNMSFEEVAARFGAKRKTEAVDRPDTAPGRQQARLSPRMSSRMSPRMSLRAEDLDNQELDRISAQYSSHEDGPRGSPSRRCEGGRMLQLLVDQCVSPCMQPTKPQTQCEDQSLIGYGLPGRSRQPIL